jgi:hypothetical protein
MSLPEHEALVMNLDRSPDRATISTRKPGTVTAKSRVDSEYAIAISTRGAQKFSIQTEELKPVARERTKISRLGAEPRLRKIVDRTKKSERHLERETIGNNAYSPASFLLISCHSMPSRACPQLADSQSFHQVIHGRST